MFFSFASTCTFCASCVGEKTPASTGCGSGKTPASTGCGSGKTSATASGVVEKPPPPQPEPQTPADYPLANEAEKPPLYPAVRDLLDRGLALVAKPYSTTRWQEARQDFEKALGLDGESNEARIGLASVLGGKMSDEWSPVLQEDPKRAERLLIEVMDKGDTANRMSAAHFALGVVLQMQNRLPEAHKEFGFSVALDPNNARAHLHLGETSLYLGNPTCRQFEEVARLSPSDYSIAAINNWALARVICCWVTLIKQSNCCKRHVPLMITSGYPTFIWPERTV